MDQIIKQNLESANGKIRALSNNWVFNTKRPILREREDATGRRMKLIHAKGSICSNPEVGEMGAKQELRKFPQNTKTKDWFVPAGICRKCQHYRKRGEGKLNYAHCGWLMKKRGGSMGGLKEVAKMIEEAAKEAKRILSP